MPEPWIDSASSLATHLSAFTSGQPLALDTEADSMHHYAESVCLVSVRQNGTTLLIDPLTLKDLHPFWELGSHCEWILHGADFDLRLLRRIGAQEPPSVFDTMLAAQLCGLKSFGYAALVEHFFGVKLDKGSQREDWSIRPLPQEMLDYAAQDVAYLEEIRDRLKNRLDELNRSDWHRESCARVVQTSRIIKVDDPQEIWRVGHSNKLSGSAQAIVRSLWHWREAEAKARDLPLFKVMGNDRLLELAEWVDANRTADHLPGFFLSRSCYGERLERLKVALVEGKQACPIPPLPRLPRPKSDPEIEKRAETIKVARDALAKQFELDPSLIASRLILTCLARDPREGAEKLISENRWCPWQAALLAPVLSSL